MSIDIDPPDDASGDALDITAEDAAPTDEIDFVTRPDGVPDKFWDANAGQIRTEALVKSYNELERRFGEPPSDVPESPDGYEITAPDGLEDLLGSDPEVNTQLHEAGFNQSQAALVYQLAAERLIPLAEHMAAEIRGAGEQDALRRHFGSDAAWHRVSPQIKAWGQANLSPDAFDALASTASGVISMHNMMQSGEPRMVRGGSGPGAAYSEAELKRMMEDPRYWRDEDPGYVARVQRGFETLYPN